MIISPFSTSILLFFMALIIILERLSPFFISGIPLSPIYFKLLDISVITVNFYLKFIIL